MFLIFGHLMNTGLGPFYDGLVHFFTTPEDLLPVLALSLLSGQRGPRFGRIVLFVLPLAWIVGCAAGRLFAPHWIWPVLSAGMTLALGALVAADFTLPAPVVAGFAVLLGLWNGSWNGVELTRARAAAFGTSLGAACAVFVVVAIVAALVASLRIPWTRIVVRVAGSWTAAAALFMLGWSLRPA